LTLTELTEKERRRIHIRVLALAIADARHTEIEAARKAAAAAEPVAVNTRTCRRCHQVLELDQFGRDLKKRDDKNPRCKACINALAAQAREQVGAWSAVASSSRGDRG
jgi:cytochrome c5